MLAASLLAFILVAAAATAARQPHDRRTTPAAIAANSQELILPRLLVRPPTLYRGHDAAYWAARFRHRTRQLQNARAVLRHRPSVTEAIELACTTYRVSCSLMWSLARCESGLDPRAFNPSSSSGLFQLLYPSTWRTTPFERFSPWSPYANSLAAAFMLSQGRRSEWVC